MALPAAGSLLLHRRGLQVSALLLTAALVVALIALLTGAYRLTTAEAVGVLRGGGSELDRFIVLDQRLPRIVAALLVGSMLAVSGAVFQSLSRNPLGSPDIVGFTTGASTGGLVVILLSAASTTTAIAAGATVGGLATAVLVVAVAQRRSGGEPGESLVLAGVALSEMLSAFNDYLISRATIESAEAAKAWQFGSLNAISWDQVRPLMVGAGLLLPLMAVLCRPAGALEMGDDAAAALGVGVGRARGALVGYGVVLASVCVAVAGPIGFLALAAPQLARRVSRSAGVPLGASAAMGCLILMVADLIAARLLSPFQIPVGLVSAGCGGLYLMWLLGLRGPREEG
ncbi:enterobactin ABC transporter permease [Actinomyces capricornis]|uniref:Enterobactin ABC transporter permease n=1 Tax=Actinomyces capricornis TaxID=2755559 RepID=A0ABM7U842_9ACTO|nr:enterobactin ABC transporter permease [Actinomyces capricornis]